MLLIHGSGPGASGWANFSRNMAPLARHFRAICSDLPGFGKSDMKPVGSPIRGFFADSVNHFLYDPSQLTEALLQKRLEASLDPRIVANPPMRITPGTVLEELWRDPGLTKLPHATLMIWGREDRVLPLDSAFVLMQQIPRARLLVMPQIGHWAQWEHAEEFNATVTQFFKP